MSNYVEIQVLESVEVQAIELEGDEVISQEVNSMEVIIVGTGVDGDDGREILVQKGDTHLQWKYEGQTEWTNLISIEEITGGDGEDGVPIEIQNNGTFIQWRYVGAPSWTNLIELIDLKGNDGTNGMSAYETWLDNGNFGTEQEFLDSLVAEKTNVIDNLTSITTDEALSANQGKILKDYIDAINALLSTDDIDLDQLQELVDFMKLNRDMIENLTIGAISGLQDALNAKQDEITLGDGSQYFKGDFTLGTFPTNLSSFTNDVGFITVAISYLGQYSYYTNYAKNDVVYDSGNSYISLVDSNIYNSPYDGSSYWGMIAKKGDKGDMGEPGSPGAQGDPGPKGDTGGDSYSYYYDINIYIDGTNQGTYESIYFHTGSGTSSGNNIYLGNGGGGGSINWMGDWSYYTSYTVGDIVFYDGSSWHCTSSNAYNYPYEGSSYWALVAKKGNDGSTGSQGPQGDPGPKGDTGGDSYTYNNDYYYDMGIYIDGSFQGTYESVYFYTGSGSTSGNNIYLGNGGGGGGKTFDYSLYDDGTYVHLDGDVESPGASYYYGTDSAGTKGWYDGVLRWRNTYYEYTTYYPGDVVERHGEIYICFVSSYNTYPEDSSYYWTGGGNTGTFYTGDTTLADTLHFKNGRLIGIN